jgi:hypothetical protein
MTESAEMIALTRAVQRLRRQNRWIICALVTIGIASVLLVASGSTSLHPPLGFREGGGRDSVLQLRGLEIVDASGRVRVRLGAPLPGPIIGGRERRRGAPISGIVIADSDGDERGGFATSDGPAEKSEAFIGLDSRDGQTTLFLANPHNGANLQVWDQKGNSVGLFAVENFPFIRVNRGDSTIFQVPRNDKPAVQR